MRKFIVQSKNEKFVIMEVECEVIKPIENSSILWSLNPGEYYARIVAPESTYQKTKQKDRNGKEVFVMVPDIWCWHSFYDSLKDAETKAETLIRKDFSSKETEEDIQKAISEIEVVRLRPNNS